MELREISKVKVNPKVVAVRPGDTVKVVSLVKEGDRVRPQAFQGVVIKKGGTGPAISITVRRIASGIGVERTFLLYSPLLESVELVREGKVNRVKLFYLRGLSARDARIKEKGRGIAAELVPAEAPAEAVAAPADAAAKPS
ncbi:MAG: 50S ribosomal protein L19 [Chloroflexi bacterium]|nr:50S ribosomal protein L19 [Chloroflexota bacterium]